MRTRSFCLLLASVIIFFSYTGCAAEERDIYSLVFQLSELFPEDNTPAVFYSESKRAEFNGLSREEFGHIYSGRFEQPSCMSRIKGYAIRLPQDDSGFEIHIIKCVNRSDTDEIASLLRSRIDMLHSSEILEYAPESFQRYFAGAEVFIYKELVFLLATPDNRKVKAFL